MATEPEPVSFVTVQFFGICTHFGPESIAPNPADWGHRVVLVNASDPKRFASAGPIQAAGIGPHLATLQVLKSDMEDRAHPPNEPWFPLQPTSDTDDAFVWSLNGVFLTIGNAIASTADPQMQDCIPHLKDYVVGPIPLAKAGPRSWEALPAQTACFFDSPATPLIGKAIFGQAAVGVLQVAVEGRPTIEVIGFGGETLSFGIHPKAEISVSNIPEDLTLDKDQDFLLHFLTVEPPFPDNAIWPVDQPPCAQPLVTNNLPLMLRITQITTEGCSNSTYP